MIPNRLALVVTLTLTGCATATYAPPDHEATSEAYQKTIDKGFDEVWKNLIDYSAQSFFAIENFEKDSGLITLSFGASNAKQYITGGSWKYSNASISFKGDYVEFQEKYNNAQLKGKMNIVVLPVGHETTRVRVNARYIWQIPQTNQSPRSTWSFDSGSCATIQVQGKTPGTKASRTVCPTYEAENRLLSALQE